MPSLDVVSKTNIAEVDNALNGIAREVKQRFDLKDRMCSVARSGNILTVTADNDMLLRQMHDLLHTYCARRGVDSRVLEFKPPENATKDSLRQEVSIRQGIDQELGKQIIKMVKGTKLKVQATIQGDELRITGKKRDDLQSTIASIKEMKVDLPLQYVNFRD
ncbi:YajQ family cyclic di-GMP-binding protein [Dehalococcoidia bacterium]|nr:YajQ family cyclic di-GMP-binding protein [Dehalococcoidia bacterium]